MFAPQFAPALHESLASHVFGRFGASSLAIAAPGAVARPALPMASTAAAVDEEEFDLAQRVREIGEW